MLLLILSWHWASDPSGPVTDGGRDQLQKFHAYEAEHFKNMLPLDLELLQLPMCCGLLHVLWAV
jgi:hypothetical protein